VKSLASYVLGALALSLLSSTGCARQPAANARDAAAAQTWSFAVAGDSRNCGNIVMPAIAAAARKDHAAFYWHLGDLRAIYKPDEDYVFERRFAAFSPPPSAADYLLTAWPDFLQHQVQAFGDTPFFIGIGNHETIAPKTRAQFLIEFQPLLDRPELRQQRSDDAALMTRLQQASVPRTYYHWIERGVDFINLDNAVGDAFDVAELVWFDAIVEAAVANPKVTTIVVGMHEALPYSKSDNHSMCGTLSGREGGKHVYGKLVAAQAKAKHVYVLASHSHYYLANVFDTEHWRDPANGGVVLPGWVIGTAGAERYPLPPGISPGADAREHVYGYLAAAVNAHGVIEFKFHELTEADLQAARSSDYAPEDVAYCFGKNPDPVKLEIKRAAALTCEESMIR